MCPGVGRIRAVNFEDEGDDPAREPKDRSSDGREAGQRREIDTRGRRRPDEVLDRRWPRLGQRLMTWREENMPGRVERMEEIGASG